MTRRPTYSRRFEKALRAVLPRTGGDARRIHFLHVSKAAGSQVSDVLERVNQTQSAIRMVKHPHKVALGDLHKGEEYFFSTRDPITRFKSGFYSRLREGKPRYKSPWSENERVAFAHFSHANTLAEALFEPGEEGVQAAAAIRSISHCARNLVDWFRFQGGMFELRPPIWIIRQEHFEADLRTLLDRIGLEHEALPDRSEGKVHANDYSGIPDLSAKAQDNLRKWYAQDYEFLRLCEAWMLSQSATGAAVQGKPALSAEVG